uniref:ATP synthase F0 subunit 8 n=1 Tax=Urochela caudata TaxID=2880904 RepID=UPI001D110FDF|nr:ATP synthase F0 subunit 8 [Urochela caudata]UCC46120.1 ATP synthase F0 subunit 8 [Urochela caudata]
MPQMMPMWWEILMIFFIVTMMMYMIILYHNKPTSYNMNIYKKMNNQYSWMW